MSQKSNVKMSNSRILLLTNCGFVKDRRESPFPLPELNDSLALRDSRLSMSRLIADQADEYWICQIW